MTMIGVPSHPFLRALQFFPARHLVYRLLLRPVSLTPLMLLVFRYPGGVTNEEFGFGIQRCLRVLEE